MLSMRDVVYVTSERLLGSRGGEDETIPSARRQNRGGE